MHADARGRIAVLKEKANQHSHVIAILEDEVTQLSTDFGRLVGEVSALRSAAAGIRPLLEEVSALKPEIAQKLKDPVLEQLSTEFNEVRNEVSALKTRIAAIPGVFDSRIISDFPEIFAEFRKNQISLLWRGSRDGFKAEEFRRVHAGGMGIAGVEGEVWEGIR
jgi:predicted  nucleic acid-binding Zn-ribbon protein